MRLEAKHVQVAFRTSVLVDLPLYEAIDVDGSTWTLEKDGPLSKLTMTLEKVEQAFWLRVKD